MSRLIVNTPPTILSEMLTIYEDMLLLGEAEAVHLKELPSWAKRSGVPKK